MGNIPSLFCLTESPCHCNGTDSLFVVVCLSSSGVMITPFEDCFLPNNLPQPYRLMITQGEETAPTEIEHKDCSTPHDTLGVIKARNRSQAKEISHLKQKCKEPAKAILSNSLSSTGSTITDPVYRLTSIGYSLSTTYITSRDFTKIQGPSVSSFLASSGYNRHMKREFVFTPQHHGRIGMVPLLLLLRG